MTASITEHRFPDADRLADALAGSIAARLRAAIVDRGCALMAVSGGRSPAAVFDRLGRAELDWRQVIIAQVDERWVAPEDPASNARLIRDHLLGTKAAAARFVPMKNDAASPAEGQPACEAALAALPGPFDLILLGMGDDGHTASLFPAMPELGDALTTTALCAAATASVAPHPRMTLTRRALLESRALILQIGGAVKEAVYRRALGDGPVEEMPVRVLFRQNEVPVEVWIGG
jgi:6-phosphogluconolactonase